MDKEEQVPKLVLQTIAEGIGVGSLVSLDIIVGGTIQVLIGLM